MERTEALNVALYKRLKGEMEQFRSELLSMAPEWILKRAHEFAVKQDLLLSLEYNDLTAEQAQALLDEEISLDELYHIYESQETHYMEEIFNSIEAEADA